jgi:hypothetical protein
VKLVYLFPCILVSIFTCLLVSVFTFSFGFQFNKANAVAPKAMINMGIHTNSQPITGKNAASSRMTAPRMKLLNAEKVLLSESLLPKCDAMPAEPMEEIVSERPSKIQATSFEGPKGSAKRIMIGMRKAIKVINPIQNVAQGVLSTRVCAREMSDGNKSHQAVSIAGKAMPMIKRMKKMAEMSAIGISFRLVDVRDTEVGRKKLQEKRELEN